MEQLPFEWADPTVVRETSEVSLDPATADAAVALMARALVVVVRAVEETDDER